MPEFKIKVVKDFTKSKDTIKGIGFKIYCGVVNATYKMFIEFLASKALKDYNPVYEENSATFSEYNPDMEVLEEDKKKFEAFIFGDISKIEGTLLFKNALSNRWVAKVYKKLKKFVENKNSVLVLFNSMSLYVTWRIE